MVAPSAPKARPRSYPWNICWIMPETCGFIIPAAMPWISRATISTFMLPARPQAALERVKSATPHMKIVRRLLASPSRPAGTSRRPNVSAYPETVHCRPSSVACSPSRIDGSATLTMLTSSPVMNAATRQTASARRRVSGATITPLRQPPQGTPQASPQECLSDARLRRLPRTPRQVSVPGGHPTGKPLGRLPDARTPCAHNSRQIRKYL